MPIGFECLSWRRCGEFLSVFLAVASRERQVPGMALPVPSPDTPAVELVTRSRGQIVIQRVRQGLYGLCGLGIAGIVPSAFFVGEFNPAGIAIALLSALLIGAMGLILELVERG